MNALCTMPPAPDLVIIQPTPFCNINCDYCYLPNKDDRGQLSIDDLSIIINRIINYFDLNNGLDIVWHAGEPLTLPIRYYEEAFDLIRRQVPGDIKISHSFQTNGILLNEDWIELIRKYSIKVGVSLDGPKEIHDLKRKTRSGIGTFDLVMKGIQLLKQNNIAFSVIAVLGRKSLLQPRMIYDFFVNNNILDIGFNIEEIEGANESSSLQYQGVEADYINFFTELMTLNLDNNNLLKIREIKNTISRLLYEKSEELGIESRPLALLSIDYKGNCSTFSPELLGLKAKGWDSFTIGNLLIEEFVSIVKDEKYSKIVASVNNGIQLCRLNCEYFSVCGGGAPANKIAEHGTFEAWETLHCRLTKRCLTNLVLEYFDSQKKNTSL